MALAAVSGFAAAAQPPAPAAPAADVAPDPVFDVLEFVVDGNRVLPAVAIERAVYRFLGEGRRIRDVEAARESLEKAYHAAGYLTVGVDIPEQKVDAGLVRLVVTEGQVERLRVTGSRYYSLGHIRAAVPSLAAGSVPNFPQAQAELATLSRTADRRVTPVLRPGRSPGGVEVELKVEDTLPLHGNLELSNRRSPNTSELRLAGGLRYDNLFQRDHGIGLQFQTAPQNTDDVRVLSINYLAPIPGTGAQLSLYAVESRSDVAALGTVNVIGNGTILGARIVLPLPAPSAAPIFHSFSFGLDHKDFRETVNLQGADSVNNPIRYVPLVAQYGLVVAGNGSRTQFNVAAVAGLRGWFGNDDRDFAAKRFLARSNFLIGRFDLEHERSFGTGWVARARADVQLASQPLVSNEQFAAGGVDSVRGYLESEASGDDALRVRVEADSPALWTASAPGGMRLVAQGFVEGASLRVQEPLPGQTARFRLASAGVGLRLRAERGLSAGLDVAWPLRDGPRTTSNSPRVHVRIGYEF